MAEMERPPSQLENVRPTGLRPPSRLPAMASSDGRTLLETSQSDLNARTAVGGNGGLMPPPTGPVKHKMSGCEFCAGTRHSSIPAPHTH